MKGKSRKGYYDDVIDADVEEEVNSKVLKENNSLHIIESKVDDMKEDIESIKEAIQDIWHLNDKSKLPMGLQRIVRDAFQCKICLSVPINPPVIVSKCCKVIIGCERCVNVWYTGTEALTKTCPSCRIERGYSETMGLNGFLTVKKVIQQKMSERMKSCHKSVWTDGLPISLLNIRQIHQLVLLLTILLQVTIMLFSHLLG